MKELTIEEKAQRYDEALKFAIIYYKQGDENMRTMCETMFPELREDEDERIKKALIAICKGEISYTSEEDAKKYIAWLKEQGEKIIPLEETILNVWELGNYWKELTKGFCNTEYGTQLDYIAKHWKEGEYYIKSLKKQGESFEEIEYNPFDDFRNSYVEVDSNEDGFIAETIRYKDECKQGKQKPSNNKPKFKEGEWIIIDGETMQIESVGDKAYNIKDEGIIPFRLENEMHLWTIQDAKDGDVLVTSDGSIFLFKCTVGYGCKHYVVLTTDGVIQFNEGLKHLWDTIFVVHPATKEQRDTLMKSMTDAGYTFDFEKKELKKIEQRHAWSKEDEKIISKINSVLNAQEYHDGATGIKMNPYKDALNWLKSLRSQNTWKPSEEQIQALDEVYKTHGANNVCRRILFNLMNDLKQLKQL